MALRPDRRRPRGGGNDIAVLDGFAAGPVVRQEENRNALQDNSMGAHMQAILEADLRDDIDDDTALERAMAQRITDNFGPELSVFRRRMEAEQRADAGGPVFEMTAQIEGPRAAAAPNNLPARIRANAVAARADNGFGRGQGMTDWLQLRRMPTYLLTQVRRLGRDIFAQYAPTTEIEDINMIGYLPNMPEMHSQALVRDHIRWITENGDEIISDDIDFGRNIPGYRAKTSLWEVSHFNFLIVQDNHGEYVYGWPRAPRPALEAAPNVPRLR